MLIIGFLLGVTIGFIGVAILTAGARRRDHDLRCPMCWDFGWVLDCNDIGKSGGRMVELMPCFYPSCEAGRKPPSIERLVFKGSQFTAVTRHPQTGAVMAVGRN